jgi:hypothetical protein
MSKLANLECGHRLQDSMKMSTDDIFKELDWYE